MAYRLDRSDFKSVRNFCAAQDMRGFEPLPPACKAPTSAPTIPLGILTHNVSYNSGNLLSLRRATPNVVKTSDSCAVHVFTVHPRTNRRYPVS